MSDEQPKAKLAWEQAHFINGVRIGFYMRDTITKFQAKWNLGSPEEAIKKLFQDWKIPHELLQISSRVVTEWVTPMLNEEGEDSDA